MPYFAKRAITLLDGRTLDRGSVIVVADLDKLPGRLLRRGLRRRGRKPRLGYRLPAAEEPRDNWVVAGRYKQMIDGVVQLLPIGTALPDITKSKALFYLVRSGCIALKAPSEETLTAPVAEPLKKKQFRKNKKKRK